MTRHDPLAIANRMLDIRAETGEPLLLMQLMKLVYIADLWALATLGRPMSSQRPGAGNVYPAIYKAFRDVATRPITSRALVRGSCIPVAEAFDECEEDIMRAVVEGYGKLSAYALSGVNS